MYWKGKSLYKNIKDKLVLEWKSLYSNKKKVLLEYIRRERLYRNIKETLVLE